MPRIDFLGVFDTVGTPGVPGFTRLAPEETDGFDGTVEPFIALPERDLDLARLGGPPRR